MISTGVRRFQHGTLAWGQVSIRTYRREEAQKYPGRLLVDGILIAASLSSLLALNIVKSYPLLTPLLRWL
jgi:hypothetical protein